ncbi:MAG: beta-glycosidase [Muribaculaceae bacterium]|nr:beta-glycosidase [Muribaculaceae bacterium]
MNYQYLFIRRSCVFFIFLISFIRCYPGSVVRDTINLCGEWDYRLLGAPLSIPGEGTILLPNTLDLAHKSVYNPESEITDQLRREFSFSGEAIYSNSIDIPDSWKDRYIELFIERTRPSKLWVDDIPFDNCSHISSPQRYNLSSVLTPGRHKISIAINNEDSIPLGIRHNSHECSESTQTNWNGILGNFQLESRPLFHIVNFSALTAENKQVLFKINFSEPSPFPVSLKLRLDGSLISSVNLQKGTANPDILVELPDSVNYWSAANPYLYLLTIELYDKNGELLDKYSEITGFRKFKTGGNSFLINGDPVFLRGTVNAAVFPMTGHPPLNKEAWIDYFSTLKSYGFNHVRFHSWTPPEACFLAADETGIYIQTELPIWGELDRDLKFQESFLKKDLEGIMDSYSRHPSFVLFSVGNELWGDISLMKEFMERAQELDSDILTTYGSNVYLGMNGQIGDEDFLVISKFDDDIKKSVRGSHSFADDHTGGFFNSHHPNNSETFSYALNNVTVPVIAHETGQYQMYPLFSETEKYQGILKSDNLKEFEKRAGEAGTIRKNEKFAEASGKWAAKLYKAEMEMSQRTPGIGGFQLFGLQDYPGQGTSLIGILDPFMDSKGIISPEDWRQSCDDIAIYAEFPKFCFYDDEKIEIPIKTVNYTSDSEAIKLIDWQTDFAEGSIIAKPGKGLISNGNIRLDMPKVSQPKKFSLNLRDNSNLSSNKYDFWVYPKDAPIVRNVFITKNLDEALSLLNKGERVILCPDSALVANASIDPLFTTDFWNYRMYRTICDEMGLQPSPGTLGLLINDTHPVFQKFPTDNHSDWQWWPVIHHSRPIIIDRLPKDFDPIIEVIDNVERNFRIALMIECNVGRGRLLILSTDMEKAAKYPEGKWLLQSVKEYMGSKECKPLLTLTAEQVTNLLTKPSRTRLIKELKNETYQRFVN